MGDGAQNEAMTASNYERLLQEFAENTSSETVDGNEGEHRRNKLSISFRNKGLINRMFRILIFCVCLLSLSSAFSASSAFARMYMALDSVSYTHYNLCCWNDRVVMIVGSFVMSGSLPSTASL